MVKSPFGYHVILLVDRAQSATMPFEDIKAEIIDEIQTQLSNKVWQDKVIAVRSAQSIETNDEALEDIARKYAN